MKVYVSAVVPAQAGPVWAILRDFNGLPNWAGFVAESRIEQNQAADKVGCIRNFTLKNGGRIRERLLGLSDYDMSCTYSILESPMGVSNYIATLRLIPITEGDQTFVEWSAEFDAEPHREDQIAADISQNVFAPALSSLKSRFGR
jgi:hypothetical protein